MSGATIPSASGAGAETLYWDGTAWVAPGGGTTLADAFFGDSAGNDSYTGSTLPSFADGRGGNDCLDGSDGNDILVGGTGADRLEGGEGADTLVGGAASVTGTLGNPTFSNVTDDGQNDSLAGGDGNDVFIVTSTNDEVSGGAGIDTVLVTLPGGGGGVQLSDGIGIENLGAFDPAQTGDLTLIAQQNEVVANSITGAAGDDSLAGRLGADTLSGLAGNDVLEGGEENDLLRGGTGNDTLLGGLGSNTLAGDEFGSSIGGNDSLTSDSNNDLIVGGLGNDTVGVSGGSNTIYGDDPGNTLEGGNDRISTGSGNDSITGGLGNDTITSTGGANTVYGDFSNSGTGAGGNDSISIQGGSDIAVGGAGDDTIIAGDGFNDVFGQDGNDSIATGNNPDFISGGAGNDTIVAIFGNGANTVFGGPGNDSVQSGGGNDQIFVAGASTVQSGEGSDLVTVGLGSGQSLDGANNSDDVLAFNLSGNVTISNVSGSGVDWDFDYAGPGGLSGRAENFRYLRDSGGNLIPVPPLGPGDNTIFAVCFAPDTDILTAEGEVAVDSLSPGTLVATVSGRGTPMKRVLWVGHRRVVLTGNPHAEALFPIRIRAGALGEATPHRDLLVSPDHCLYLDGALVPARLLVNGETILVERGMTEVTWYHVELEGHDVLLANGAAAESWLDAGNRAWFANAPLALLRVTDTPDAYATAAAEPCAPVIQGGDRLSAIRDAIALRTVPEPAAARRQSA